MAGCSPRWPTSSPRPAAVTWRRVGTCTPRASARPRTASPPILPPSPDPPRKEDEHHRPQQFPATEPVTGHRRAAPTVKGANHASPKLTYPHPRGARRRPALVGALRVTLLVAGCSSADPETGDGEGELTFMNQSRGQEAALQQLAEQYTEETGVRIAIDSPGPADYLPRL